MAIDSKKILGDTSTEYHERTGTAPSDYIGEGVQVHARDQDWLLDEFTKKVPDNAEVVVNYRVSMGEYRAYACGTALIKKEKK